MVRSVPILPDLVVVLGTALLVARAFSAEVPVAQSAALQINNIRANAGTVGLYEKFELTFDITGTVAANSYYPYDPSPPLSPGRPADGGRRRMAV